MPLSVVGKGSGKLLFVVGRGIGEPLVVIGKGGREFRSVVGSSGEIHIAMLLPFDGRDGERAKGVHHRLSAHRFLLSETRISSS